MRALISVSDKTGVVEFARGLRELGWQVIATGGTMKLLAESGVEVINISDVTGFPEICDGRVKTLHPKGARRPAGSPRRSEPPESVAGERHRVHRHGVCESLSLPSDDRPRRVTMDEAIENIDIGGPSMLRSAAKNYKDVTVVCDPADYDTILAEIRGYGNTTPRLRLQLSAKAYTHTAEYDAMIATYMREKRGSTRSCSWSSIWFSRSATERIRTSRPSSTAAANGCPIRWPMPGNLMARRCPTITYRMPTQPLRSCGSSMSRSAWDSNI